jgi:hypothetical protein
MTTKLTITDNILPQYLSGHENGTHTDSGLIKFLMEELNCKTMVDIGAGPCGQTKLARDMGMEVLAVEGDWEVQKEIDDCVIHDFTKSPYIPEKEYDVGYSCEVLEHIWPIFAPNYMEIFKKCKWAIFTMAVPGQPGWHHVNCRTPEYWVDVFTFYGFEVDVDITNKMRHASTMEMPYIRQHGICFRNTRYLDKLGTYE